MPSTRIAVTMGDPAGIGPEICLDLLRSQPWKTAESPAVPICPALAFFTAGQISGCCFRLNRIFFHELSRCLVDKWSLVTTPFASNSNFSVTDLAKLLPARLHPLDLSFSLLGHPVEIRSVDLGQDWSRIHNRLLTILS